MAAQSLLWFLWTGYPAVRDIIIKKNFFCITHRGKTLDINFSLFYTASLSFLHIDICKMNDWHSIKTDIRYMILTEHPVNSISGPSELSLFSILLKIFGRVVQSQKFPGRCKNLLKSGVIYCAFRSFTILPDIYICFTQRKKDAAGGKVYSL